MKKYFIGMLAVMLVLSTFLVARSASAKESKILEFNSMVGVPTGMTGTKAPIRGINGGGIAWAIGYAEGELRTDGRLKIEIQGLVFAAGANIGTNNQTAFRAIVSCLDGNGAPVKILTEEFPATVGAASDGGGNAEFETTVDLPSPCIAPIIFVTSRGGSWFAATGN